MKCFLVKQVVSEIRLVFDTTVNSAKDVLRRLMIHLPTSKGAIPRAVLEETNLTIEDLPIIERFFEAEYHKVGKDQLARDLVTSIENWVIQRLETKLASNEKVNLMQFLVELGQEQMAYYAKWNNQKIAIEHELLCEEDPSDFQDEDLQKVNSLNLSGKILDHDKEILATLHHIVKESNFDIVFVTSDYSIVLARSHIEPILGFTISDPLYAIQKLE